MPIPTGGEGKQEFGLRHKWGVECKLLCMSGDNGLLMHTDPVQNCQRTTGHCQFKTDNRSASGGTTDHFRSLIRLRRIVSLKFAIAWSQRTTVS